MAVLGMNAFFLTCCIWFVGYFAASSEALGREKEFVVLYTSNTNGYIEACHCSSQNLGGLARRMTLIKQLRKELGHKALLFDAGNIFSPYPRGLNREATVAKIVQKMNYDAINLGEQEFTNGLTFLSTKLKTKRLISANVKVKGKNLAAAFYIDRVSGIKVAVTGLLTENAYSYLPTAIQAELEFSEPFAALKQALQGINQEKPDVIILMLRALDYQIEKKIAETFPEIHVILTCSEDFSETPSKVYGKTIVSSAGKDGEHVGLLKLHVDMGTQEVSATENRLIDVSPTIPPDPEIDQIIQTANLN
ncbi:5'-nucleotidase/2' 3'-cyclic phosphodiesterase and related esterase-like protein [Chloroherpeton thalassium ATCC 35110]|uniref:5'-nucleotidase/2' 3'-cyclic phosphodiesterase and related esterase-like protein n=1 Tax=Chloroherpeton thalassium (strain ATCC 35110 / GB-78) TaxID=517418 RepID=B3QU89_CHLT3|nr:bifunctional metallophosphatase/5'-nucleotidase [Chloroherpeton thalassium]ACF14338.1 5'-nucleotidase/2' 3'-cyclic phosphodiesterase and related esterase-like protein [Chloroherpeton thalassium ATCC 35110]